MTDTNWRCEEFEAMLADYLDGSLGDSEVASAELHLAACASCRTLVSDLQTISRSAAALPALTPSRDLWPTIEARIAPKVLPLAAPASRTRATWRLGAIAATLVAATAVTTWQFARRDVATPVVSSTAPASAAAVSTPAPAPQTTITPATEPAQTTPALPVASTPTPRVRAEASDTYTAEITRLRGVLSERSDVLDPATVATIEASLATIDTAIAQARGALAKDPASRFLSGQLNKSLERKLGLLRTAALLSSTT